jgi:Calcineurin-like phosphoesterase
MAELEVHVAMGDPQAPFHTVLEVLDRAGLLSDQGTLVPRARLVSMGDHFDWGGRPSRDQATLDGLALLSWLAAHPPEQVVLLLGNHDLARVCELAVFADDAAFESARGEAERAYQGGKVEAVAQAALLERFPFLPDAELLARDYACFSSEQRRLVELLLREGRFRLAHAHRGLLLVHAGVTVPDLEALGLQADGPEAVAAGLNAFLAGRVAAWTGGRLELEPWHRRGDATRGNGRGALVHRPADPAAVEPADLEGPPRRRFDPRTLPAAFPQAIGHVRDDKCRALMPAWCEPTPAGDGPLRSLVVEGDAVSYRAGCHPGARLYFTDGGMAHTRPEAYQLLDLDTLQPFSGRRRSG